MAFKFKAEQACTPVLSIDYQVGRTGAVTPVANLEPVLLAGTVVKRATLNNSDQMELLDIRIGDSVYVEKGGEIIPKITGVNLGKRPADAVKPDFPKTCPDCGTPLVRDEGEARWFCPNQDGCPMQIKGRLLHFTTRKAMDILAGEVTVEQLYDCGLARTPADLYDLRKQQLVCLEGWQERSAQRFLDSLERSREVPFERVLYALGIRHVGETKARALARHFGSIDALQTATAEQMQEAGEIGGVIAASVREYLDKPQHQREIERLRAHGLQFSAAGSTKNLSQALEGKSIVISGNFSIPREAMKELIAAHGGKNSSSISARTAFLLAGSRPGPEKRKKCEQLGIPVYDEDTFRSMLPDDRAAHSPSEEQLTLF